MSSTPGRHAGHAHGDAFQAASSEADRGKLIIALALIVGFMVAEVVAGILASSLALISDAAHMLTDAGALTLSLWAVRLAGRPPGGQFTFGFKRAEILSAQVNGAALLVLAAVIAYEGVGRLSEPPAVEGAVVIAIGGLGAAVNVAASWVLSRAERRSLNVEGALQHVLTDLYASLAAVLAGVLVVAADFDRADPIAALVVAALMLRSAWRLLHESGRVLLEASPRGTDPDEIGRSLAARPGVVEVHDLHVWEVTSGFPALAAHVLVPADTDCHRVREELEELLHERFGIEHTTLQVEHAAPRELLEIETPPG